MKNIGKPYAGKPHVRFDEGGQVRACSLLYPKRLEILHKMQGAGEMSLRELARWVERDVKGVHTDIRALLEFGLVEKTESGKIICPFDEIRFDFAMRAAA
ncbi:MAG: HVO_A0114 family putative DNA-binding protein [Sulfuricella sp.]